jgi:CheY-like chemotaxis protein
METENSQKKFAIKLLIVDDSRAIQSIIKRAVQRCGYEPIEISLASDGQQAIEMIESNSPHLVVTDWHMPKVTGLEMLQTIRQHGKADVRVGFVTTERTPTMLNEAKVNGASFILHKPFDDAELITALRTCIAEILSEHSAREVDKASLQSKPPAIAEPEIISPADMQAMLTEKLGNIPFRLICNEKMSTENMTLNNLLGLYAATDAKTVYCVAVMDANAVCIVGGGSARKTPLEVRSAMASGVPDALMLERAQHFLSGLARVLTRTSSAENTVSLAKSSLVKNTLPKFQEVMRQVNLRTDFRLSIPGYGEGRMAFFLIHR